MAPGESLNKKKHVYSIDPNDFNNIWKCINKFIQISVQPNLIVGAIFIVFLISNYKRLNTRTNIYLKHYAIGNIIFYVAKPTLGLFMTVLNSDEKFLSRIYICIVYNTDAFLLTSTLVFGVLLGLDYFIACYFNRLCKWCARIQMFVVSVIYFLYFIQFLAQKFSCLYSSEISDLKQAHLIALVLVTSKIVLHIIRLLINPPRLCRNLEYAWHLSNIIVYSWIPIVLFYFPLALKKSDINKTNILLIHLINFSLIICQYGPQLVLAIKVPFANKHFDKSVSNFCRESTRLFFRSDLEPEDSNTDSSNESSDY